MAVLELISDDFQPPCADLSSLPTPAIAVDHAALLLTRTSVTMRSVLVSASLLENFQMKDTDVTGAAIEHLRVVMNIEETEELCWNPERVSLGKSLVCLDVWKEERRSGGSSDIQQEMTSKISSVNLPHGRLDLYFGLSHIWFASIATSVLCAPHRDALKLRSHDETPKRLFLN